jgi:O-antigen ligase
MLAGFLLIGLFAVLGWVMTIQSKRWTLLAGIFAFGFWTLLLSFSRSAWLGLATGLLIFGNITFQMWWQNRQRLIRLIVIAGITLIASGLFIGIYQPFLAARAGISDEAVERRSSSDRVIYNQIALDAIKQSPILGTGIGNYPWYASDYLVKTEFDLRGQPVHNIFLSAWAELGVIGLGIFIAAIGLALLAGIKNMRQAKTNQLDEQFLYATAISGICALLVIGLFDHYPWTLIQFQIPFWGLMAIIVRPPSTPNELA